MSLSRIEYTKAAANWPILAALDKKANKFGTEGSLLGRSMQLMDRATVADLVNEATVKAISFLAEQKKRLKCWQNVEKVTFIFGMALLVLGNILATIGIATSLEIIGIATIIVGATGLLATLFLSIHAKKINANLIKYQTNRSLLIEIVKRVPVRDHSNHGVLDFWFKAAEETRKKQAAELALLSEHNDDPILKQFTCVIDAQPIARPIRDPLTKDLYRRDNLTKWIKQAGNFPPTRRPAHIFSTIGLEAYTLSSLIAFRLEQLQKAPSTDSVTRKEWILKTAHELDRQIVALFNANLDLLQEIPEFLRSAPGMHVCPITAKPICFPVKPDLDESAPLETHLICYEAAALTNFRTENPDQMPPKWPVDYAKTFKVSVDWSRQWDIKEALKRNIDQLKKYYTPLKASN